MAQVNVTIIGLQRPGLSVGLALKRLTKTPKPAHTFTIVGSDEDSDALKTAHTLGAIDEGIRDAGLAVEKADLVFVTLPYAQVKELFQVIGPTLKAGAVVVDLSPLKLPSIEWATKSFRKDNQGKASAYLVGVTPVINPAYLLDLQETAHEDLFDNGVLVLSPAADCPEEAVRLVADLADLLGIKVHFTDPAEQDGIAAAMESLPLLMQMAMFRTLQQAPGWEDLQRLGNSSFSLSTYRLEQADPEDFAILVAQNRDNTIRVLESARATLTTLIDLVRSEDQETVGDTFAESTRAYRRWLSARRKNKWDAQEERPAIQRPSMFGPLLGGLRFGRGPAKDESEKS